MEQLIKKILKEPLIHFLLIGLGIFSLYGWVSKEETGENQIVIDNSHLNHLVSIWELQWNRPPTEKELQGMLEQYVRQEIFYREALKMNLDHNDEVVKRRLAQKMEFLSDDLSALVDPVTDEKLMKYYQVNQEKYLTPYQYSFRQVVFTRDHHEDPEKIAREVLEKFGKDSSDNIKDKGDPLSIRYMFDGLSEPQVEKELGGELAVSLRDIPLEEWSGPVVSGYGVHLIYLTKKVDPQLPAFGEIRDQLARDYAYKSEEKNKQAIFESLKSKYQIEITADLDDQFRERLQANLIEK